MTQGFYLSNEYDVGWLFIKLLGNTNGDHEKYQLLFDKKPKWGF